MVARTGESSSSLGRLYAIKGVVWLPEVPVHSGPNSEKVVPFQPTFAVRLYADGNAIQRVLSGSAEGLTVDRRAAA